MSGLILTDNLVNSFIPTSYSLPQRDLELVANQLAGEWNDLRDARLFITGGTGFFGIWLLESLLWATQMLHLGMSITVLSRTPGHFLSVRAPHLQGRENLHFIKGSLTDFVIPDEPFTHILHAASETNIELSADWASRHIRSALDGTRRLLDMAAKHRVKAVLLTTSGAIYTPPMDSIVDGRCIEGPQGLEDYCSERSVYSQAKRMMEVMTCVEGQQHGYRAAIARCFAFVGPYLPLEGNYAIGNFIRDAMENKPIVVNGDGTPLRSYLYAADLVIWLLTILTRGRSGVPYNVGGEAAVSIGQLASTVSKLAGRSVDTVKVMGQAVPGAPVSSYLPDLSRASNELGLVANIDLEDAVARTLAWHRLRTTNE